MHAEFAGERAGTAPLTWGQRGMWEAIGRNPPGHFNIPMVLAAPRRPAVSVRRAAEAIGGLVSRHESLRTRIIEIEAGPAQEVARLGRLPIEVVEGGVAAEVQASLAGPAFAYPDEWPLRVGLVTQDGAVRQIVLVFCHTATDWQGAEVVARDLRLLLRGSALPALELQPLDLARAQAVSGADRTRRAVDYWTGAFRSMPPAMFPAAGTPPEPPNHQAVLTSRALDGAARAIAARHRVSTTTVLLAATVGLIGSWTGHRMCALHTLVNNRFQAGHADIVGMLAQLGLVVVDLSDAPAFDELVTRTWQAALLGYRRAYYDQAALDATRAEVGRERGTVINPFCCFNDMRSTVDTEPGIVPDPAAMVAALGESTLAVEPHAPLNCRFCLRVEPAAGTLTVVLTADARSLSSVQIGQFLTDLERVVVNAACQSDCERVTPAGLP